MPIFDLILLASTEGGVHKISVPVENEWHFKIKCTHCNENYPNVIFFKDTDKVQHKVEASSVNFLSKCKNCQRQGSMQVIKDSPREAEVAHNGKAKGVLARFDCRGLEPVGFEAGNSLNVLTTNGKTYEQIDISDLWAEYDEDTEINYTIEDVKFEIVKSAKH